jgi:hypothetical protein
MRRLRKASHSAKVQTQIGTLRAGLTLWDREMKLLQQDFGVECFELMERNRNMGDPSGGECDPEVVEVFVQCVREMKALIEIRKRKLTELTLAKGEKALCYVSKRQQQQQQEREKGILEQTKGQSSQETTMVWSGEPSSSSTSKMGPGPAPASSPSSSSSPEPPVPSMLSRSLALGWMQATQSFRAYNNKSELKSDLTYIDHEILMRKQQFGVEMYTAMFFGMGPNWQPRDVDLQTLYSDTKLKMAVPYSKRQRADKEINDLDSHGFVLVSHEEIQDFVRTHPTMYAMLGVNTGIPDDQCQNVAVRVAIELTSQKQGLAAQTAILTKRQFDSFVKNYVDNCKGAHEFFHRSVFSAFDDNGNGTLDRDEIDTFLNTFYKSGSIFQGDARLPEQEILKEMIYAQLEAKGGSGEFSFDEIRCIISGSTDCSRRVTPVRPSWTGSMNDMIMHGWGENKGNHGSALAELEELYDEDEEKDEEEEEAIRKVQTTGENVGSEE